MKFSSENEVRVDDFFAFRRTTSPEIGITPSFCIFCFCGEGDGFFPFFVRRTVLSDAAIALLGTLVLL